MEVKMGTLKKLKFKMKLDKNLRHAMLKGTKNEILLDLDGDNDADLALLDLNFDGDIDAIALDLDGNGELDFYVVDSDHNGVPDQILFDEKEDGNLTVLAAGKDVEDAIIAGCTLVARAIEAGEYITANLDEALDSLEKDIKKARKALKKI